MSLLFYNVFGTTNEKVLYGEENLRIDTIDQVPVEVPQVKQKKEMLESRKVGEYPAIVQQIHTEFMTAGDKLLAEANAVLTQEEREDAAKARRLKALGFTGVESVIDNEILDRKKEAAKAKAELIQSYALKYPNFKFIEENQVNQICQKYNLVKGAVSLFKGFVPESKLEIMENFALKREDFCFYYETGYGIMCHSLKNAMDCFPDFKILEEKENEILVSYLYERSFSNEKFTTKTTFHSKSFQICAPLKDMNMKESKVSSDGYTIIPLDPVVLQPVAGGYLVICAWGDEASDPIVVNQKMN